MSELVDVTLQLPEEEYAALVAFHESPEGGESIALSARKLVVDGLVGLGILGVNAATPTTPSSPGR